MSTVEIAIVELKSAPESIARETLDFIMFLKQKAALPPATKTDSLGYPIGYFSATAGSFADETLERPEQPSLAPAPVW